MKQAHVFISGYVQGVGYRYFVRSNAQKLGLTGWVRNTPARNASAPARLDSQSVSGRSVAGGEDGGVEAVFVGDEKVIEEMIALCRKGPFLSEVKQLGVDWEKIEEEFEDFTIR